MRKSLFFGFIFLAFSLQACGGIAAGNTQETAVATETTSEDSPPARDFIPYGKNIRFEQINIEEGLSQSVATAILQDRKGFLWIGTDDGLNRYDGYSFKVYKPDPNNPASLNDHSITTIAEDAQGYLWVGTQRGGLNRFDPTTGNFSHYLHNEADDQTVSSNRILSLFMDEAGLWIGTDHGLDYLDLKTEVIEHFRPFDDAPADERRINSDVIWSLFKDSRGLLWIGTNNEGVNVYDPALKIFKVYRNSKDNPASLSNNRILSITEDLDGNIWIGTSNGLNRFDPLKEEFKRFENSRQRESSLAGNIVNAILVDQSGGIWVGTNNGLDRYDAKTNRFIHHQSQPGVSQSLSNNQILSLYEDRSGVIWIGTFSGGVNKYSRQQDQFAYYRHDPTDSNSLSSNFIMSILARNNRYVWIGTLDSGLDRFDPVTGSFVNFQNNPNSASTISSNFVHSLYLDANSSLWVGTGRSLDQYLPSRNIFVHYQPEEVLENENLNFSVAAIFEDSRKRLWVGSNLGLMRFDRTLKVFSKFNLSEAESPQPDEINVSAILEDSNNNLWVGTADNGVKVINFDSGSITTFENDINDRTSLGNDTVLCLYQDSRGVIWVGTHGGGLSRFDPDTLTFTNFTENEGVPNNVIYGILEDDAGNLWLSTNFGLSRFDPLTESFRNFTASDGLQSNEFNQNAFARDGNGTMYFGGINGMNIFHPRNIKDSPFLPSISLTTITMDGAPINNERTPEYSKDIVLNWPGDSFEFEFAAFAYEQPDKNQYAYKLDGFDPDWIEIGTQRNGRYTNLPGGSYTLRLRASNSDGVWSEGAQPIRITVIPPFWETWWFGGLLVIAFGVTLVGGLRWRVKSIENRNHELERLVRLRTADLEKRNSEIEALYQADEKIIRSVTVNHIFQALVNVSVSMLQADRSVVFAWNEVSQKVMPRVNQGFQPETISALRFDRNEGLIGAAMNSGEAVIVAAVDLSILRPDIRRVIELEGIQSFAHFPIVVDERVVAIFNVAYTRPNALTKDSIRLFTALVNRASLSIANMELFEQTRDLAVMEERNRLARDLHDSAKQKAFAALAQLGTANGMAKAAVPLGSSPHISEAETLVYEVIQELNFLIQEIYPIALQEKGLPVVLREYIFEWENRNDAIVSLTIQNERVLPLDTEQAVYRVIQEALANVSRHSRANQVNISLVYNSELLQVTMADNGLGFNVNQKATGLGFRSMRERISSIRGTFQVQSAPGQGTRIIIQIPLKSNGVS